MYLVFVGASKIELFLPWVLIAVTLNGLKFDMLMYPDHFRTDYILAIV